MTLDELLEDVAVHDPAMLDNSNQSCAGWWAVSTGDEGIIAYFFKETDAFRFRLDLINRKLNP